jgi:predicted transcriptional regulator
MSKNKKVISIKGSELKQFVSEAIDEVKRAHLVSELLREAATQHGVEQLTEEQMQQLEEAFTDTLRRFVGGLGGVGTAVKQTAGAAATGVIDAASQKASQVAQAAVQKKNAAMAGVQKAWAAGQLPAMQAELKKLQQQRNELQKAQAQELKALDATIAKLAKELGEKWKLANKT